MRDYKSFAIAFLDSDDDLFQGMDPEWFLRASEATSRNKQRDQWQWLYWRRKDTDWGNTRTALNTFDECIESNPLEFHRSQFRLNHYARHPWLETYDNSDDVEWFFQINLNFKPYKLLLDPRIAYFLYQSY